MRFDASQDPDDYELNIGMRVRMGSWENKSDRDPYCVTDWDKENDLVTLKYVENLPGQPLTTHPDSIREISRLEFYRRIAAGVIIVDDPEGFIP